MAEEEGQPLRSLSHNASWTLSPSRSWMSADYFRVNGPSESGNVVRPNGSADWRVLAVIPGAARDAEGQSATDARSRLQARAMAIAVPDAIGVTIFSLAGLRSLNCRTALPAIH